MSDDYRSAECINPPVPPLKRGGIKGKKLLGDEAYSLSTRGQHHFSLNVSSPCRQPDEGKRKDHLGQFDPLDFPESVTHSYSV